LDVGLVVVGTVGVRRAARVESGRGVLQREAHVDELLLDLLDGLGTEVADVQEVLLGAGDQLAHAVDPLPLEAVVGANRQVEVLDRQRQVGGERGVRGGRAHVDALGVDVELPRQPEQLDQRLAGARDGVTRPDARLGLDVQDQPVEVGALLDTGGLDLVGDPQDRRVDGVDRDAADLLAGLLVLGRRDVTAAALDRQLHLQLALAVEGGDVQVGVVHLDPRRRGDVRCGDDTGTLLAQVHQNRLVVLGGDDEALEVQDDLGDVLLDAGHGGELVLDALDADAGDGRTGDGGEQGPPERVADGVAEARLQRLDDELGPELRQALLGEGRTLSDQHVTVFLSHGRPLYDGHWTAPRSRSLIQLPTRSAGPRCGPRGRRGAALPGSDPAALRRTAAVVRHRRDVLDGAHLQAGGLERADGGLAAGARTLDEDVDLAHPVLLGAAGGGLGGHLRGERGGLARPLEADLPGARPRDHRTGGVGDAHDGVVERALDVSMPVGDVLLFLAAHLARGALLAALRRHSFTLPRSSIRTAHVRAEPGGLLLAGLLLTGHGLLLALAGAGVGLRALTVDREAAAVTDALGAGDRHLAADVGLDLAAQVALDLVVRVDPVAQAAELVLGELVHTGVGVDPGVLEGLVRAGAADPENVGESDLHALVAREVDAGKACHVGDAPSCCAEVLPVPLPSRRPFDEAPASDRGLYPRTAGTGTGLLRNACAGKTGAEAVSPGAACGAGPSR